jgi:hypothetical protein
MYVIFICGNVLVFWVPSFSIDILISDKSSGFTENVYGAYRVLNLRSI